jgi:hypothetical protein
MTTVEKKSLSVGKRVNTTHVDQVIRNYKQERWVHNSERIGKEDSLSAWWSIEELEQFIEEAKMHGADGMKFYFAAYDAETASQPEYEGRQTLVMVGTKQKENVDGSTRNRDIYVQTDKGTNILAYNAGRLCPPNCGTAKPTDNIDDYEIGISIIDRGDKGVVVI